MSDKSHGSRAGVSVRKAPALFRNCTVCGKVIPPARLYIKPNATQCVPCLENAGDVPRIRQFTETTKDGEVIATHFRTNSYIESALNHVLTKSAPEGAYRIAAGDDADFARPSRALLETVRIQDVMTEDK